MRSIFILQLAVAIGLSGLSYIRTDGFSESVIHGQFPDSASQPPSEEIGAILRQPFHYLGKGRQCFVFESEDGLYVVKFFNQKYLKDPWYAFLMKGEKKKRQLRRKFYQESYSIAYREFGDGLVYLHLGPSGPLPPLHCLDRAHGEHQIDLSGVPFVLQRKGTLIYPWLRQVMQREGIEGLKKQLDAYVAVIQQRIDKKIGDIDQDVANNWGYIDGKLVQLDPGRLYYTDLNTPDWIAQEWRRATVNLYKWLNNNYKEAGDYFNNIIVIH